jgi:hypothetical protein
MIPYDAAIISSILVTASCFSIFDIIGIDPPNSSIMLLS